jgi:type II secretory pathway component GspD/PulD (secretin)
MGNFAEPVPPPERPVQFEFVGTPIREAVSEVTRQSGLSVIVDPGVGDATVTARAEDPVPAAAALRAVAEAAGLRVTQRDGALVVEKAEDTQ